MWCNQFCEDHANVSVVISTICIRYSSKHCSEFMVELVHIFICQLSIDLGDVENLVAFFDVLFDTKVAMSCVFCLREELIATARQLQKMRCNEQVVINL